MPTPEITRPPAPSLVADPYLAEEAALSRRVLMFRAFRHRDYRLLWTGAFLSNIGTWMQVVAQGWLVRKLTPSPFLIGFVSFAGSFPQLTFSLFSGVYADTFDRRRLLLGTQAVQMLLAALLGLLVALDVVDIWHVIAISFAAGLATTLSNPTWHAFIFDIVGPDDLVSGVALNSTQYNLSRVIGPTVGGVTLTVIGMAGCFYFNGLSFLAVIAALLMMKVTMVRPRRSARPREVIRQIIAGLNYVRGRPRVLALLGLAAITSIFGIPYLVFLPVFARDVLLSDAQGLSWLLAATGSGAVISALLQAFLGNFRGRGKFLLGGTLLFGCLIMAFALSRHFTLSLILLSLIGGAMVSITTSINTLLQMLVTDEMRGRVMSMYSFAFLGLPPVGSLLIGAAADLTGSHGGFHGTQLSLAGSGAIIALFVIYVLITRPRVREL